MVFSTWKLDCCGVNPVLSATNDFDQTSWCLTSGTCKTGTSEIPKTCCVNVDESSYTSAPAGCHTNVNSGTYNTKVVFYGFKWICFASVVNWTKNRLNIFCRIVVHKINNLDVPDFLKICYMICTYRDVTTY